MKIITRMLAVLTAFTLMITMIPMTVFAEEVEYATVILELDEGTDLVDLEGNSLADVLTSDGKGGYVCEVGTVLEFTIEVEDGYELMYECYNLDAPNPEDCFGGENLDWNESKSCYSIPLDMVGTYTVMTYAETWESNLMSCFGISAGGNYFTAEEKPSEYAIIIL